MYHDYTGSYDVKQLWTLTAHLPIRTLPTENLLINLDYTEWATDLLAREVFENLALYPEHKQRIEAAELSYPILIDKNGIIIDGLHRLCRYIQLGFKDVLVRVVTSDMMSQARISNQSRFSHSV
jgi:hypothetical protein